MGDLPKRTPSGRTARSLNEVNSKEAPPTLELLWDPPGGVPVTLSEYVPSDPPGLTHAPKIPSAGPLSPWAPSSNRVGVNVVWSGLVIVQPSVAPGTGTPPFSNHT